MAKLDPETLAIRAKPGRAIRFKRGILIAIAAVASLTLTGVAWFALKPGAFTAAHVQDDRALPENREPLDALSGLPSS